MHQHDTATRPATTPLADIGERRPSGRPSSDLATVIRSVRAATVFRGRIRFHNLTDMELGAVLAALELSARCRHKLGMGKPLGLGTVRITSSVRLVDRSGRYDNWVGSGVLADQASAQAVNACWQAFARRVLEHVARAGEATVKGGQGLGRVARIDALYTVLDWEGRPDPEATRYLRLQPNEFKGRDVLPTPHWVAGKPEPAWPGEPPRMRDTALEMRAAPSRRESSTPTSRRRTPKDRRRQRQDASRRQARNGPGPANRPAPGRPTIQRGDTVRCQALEERTKTGLWRFRTLGLPQQRVGFLQRESAVPPDLEPGQQVDLVVAQAPADPKLAWTFRWKPSAGTS